MSHPSRLLLFLVLVTGYITSTAAALAQKPPALTGSVTGFVYDGETRLPIRFAEINVVPAPSKTVTPVSAAPDSPNPHEEGKRVQRINGSSGMDGGFHLHVPEGDYVVAALKPGYLTPGAAAAGNSFLPDDQAQSILRSLPLVHVGAGGTASVTLTLQRGAAIGGKVLFADGGPAIGAAVAVESIDYAERLERVTHPQAGGKTPSQVQETLFALFVSQRASEKVITDDEGRYRIFGIPPGKYFVGTLFLLDQSMGRVAMSDGSDLDGGRVAPIYPEMVAVYAPASFRHKDAKVFEVRGNEQITNADVMFDPSQAHTLQGRVLSAEDRHAPETMIRLKEGEASIPSRFVQSREDGTFRIDYLPSGSYTLQIDSFERPDPTNPGTEPVRYRTVQVPAVVGEHDVLLDDVLLVRLKAGEHNELF